MKPAELYSFTNKRQIWRIIPSGVSLIIEEREPESKQVFFNCINIETGRVIFRNYQTEEKFWIGVEAVYKDVIFFHKFSKPDMPGHKEIIAVDLYTQQTLWNTSEYTFLLALENKIYSYINLFEGRKYFVLDYMTGEVLESLADNQIDINELRYKSYDNEFFKDSFFPELCRIDDPVVSIIFKSTGKPVAGRVECVNYNGYVFTSYHVEENKGVLKNIFNIVEISTEKIIFEEILNRKTQKFIPDNFFIKGDKLFLIKEKSVLKVYSIK
jgi:hypothetical protein